MSEEEPKKLKPLTEGEFLTAVRLIAESHNCSIVEIDMEKKIVNLSGAKKDELKCAIALGDFFEKYETDEGIEVTETIETVMGWPK